MFTSPPYATNPIAVITNPPAAPTALPSNGLSTIAPVTAPAAIPPDKPLSNLGSIQLEGSEPMPLVASIALVLRYCNTFL